MTKSVAEKIQTMMTMLSSRHRRILHPDFTVAELEALRQDQNVACLPEMYIQLMVTGIIRVLDANVSPKGLMDFRIKETLLEELDEENLDYPQDLFAFYEHNNGDEIMFFRTKDCPEDPPVYGYRGEGYFDKLANSISDLILETLEQYSRRDGVQQTEGYGHQTEYYFDSHQDEFYGTPSPSYDGPLPIEMVLEKLGTKIERVSSKYGHEFQGCTEAELEDLKRSQNVACLPEAYHKFMLLMGKAGTGWALGNHGDSEYGELIASRAKEVLISELETLGKGYPKDIFVFFTHAEMSYHFFRTQDCGDDPVVFSYRNNFYKLADSFSQFLLHNLDPSG